MDTIGLKNFLAALAATDEPHAARIVSMIAFGKDPAVDHAVLVEDDNTRGGTPYHDGRTDNVEFYKRVWVGYSSAPIRFTLRNFTSSDRIPTPAIMVPGIGWNRVYTFSCRDYAEFDAALGALITSGIDEHKSIPISWWKDNGQKIANLTGRTVLLIHQYGSGDPDQAEFNNFGPFVPDGRDWKGELLDWHFSSAD